MQERYVVTITEGSEPGKLKVVAVDKKHSKVVFEATISKELRADVRQLFKGRYEKDVLFLDAAEK